MVQPGLRQHFIPFPAISEKLKIRHKKLTDCIFNVIFTASVHYDCLTAQKQHEFSSQLFYFFFSCLDHQVESQLKKQTLYNYWQGAQSESMSFLCLSIMINASVSFFRDLLPGCAPVVDACGVPGDRAPTRRQSHE